MDQSLPSINDYVSDQIFVMKFLWKLVGSFAKFAKNKVLWKLAPIWYVHLYALYTYDGIKIQNCYELYYVWDFIVFV